MGLSGGSSSLRIVTENDGTEIDDDDVLAAVCSDAGTVLMILQDGESWNPSNQHEVPPVMTAASSSSSSTQLESTPGPVAPVPSTSTHSSTIVSVGDPAPRISEGDIDKEAARSTCMMTSPRQGKVKTVWSMRYKP